MEVLAPIYLIAMDAGLPPAQPWRHNDNENTSNDMMKPRMFVCLLRSWGRAGCFFIFSGASCFDNKMVLPYATPRGLLPNGASSFF